MTKRKKSTDSVLNELKDVFHSPTSIESTLKSLADSPFKEYFKDFRESQNNIAREMRKAIIEFATQPLFAAFMTWIEQVSKIDPNIYIQAHTLISEHFLTFHDNKGTILSVAHVKNFHHNDIINKIRSQRKLSLEFREDLVKTYLNFTRWLEKQTYEFVNRAIDHDAMKRHGRIIDYTMFVKFLGQLDDKMQLVAKLLYFGGSRTLDEVLSLELTDVDYKKRTIKFGSHLISYPAHVFSDIEAFTHIRTKSKGRIFLGRQNSNLNPATVFRNFKEAASRVGLGDSFSPKSLTTNI